MHISWPNCSVIVEFFLWSTIGCLIKYLQNLVWFKIHYGFSHCGWSEKLWKDLQWLRSLATLFVLGGKGWPDYSMYPFIITPAVWMLSNAVRGFTENTKSSGKALQGNFEMSPFTLIYPAIHETMVLYFWPLIRPQTLSSWQVSDAEREEPTGLGRTAVHTMSVPRSRPQYYLCKEALSLHWPGANCTTGAEVGPPRGSTFKVDASSYWGLTFLCTSAALQATHKAEHTKNKWSARLKGRSIIVRLWTVW